MQLHWPSNWICLCKWIYTNLEQYLHIQPVDWLEFQPVTGQQTSENFPPPRTQTTELRSVPFSMNWGRYSVIQSIRTWPISDWSVISHMTLSFNEKAMWYAWMPVCWHGLEPVLSGADSGWFQEFQWVVIERYCTCKKWVENSGIRSTGFVVDFEVSDKHVHFVCEIYIRPACVYPQLRTKERNRSREAFVVPPTHT